MNYSFSKVIDYYNQKYVSNNFNIVTEVGYFNKVSSVWNNIVSAVTGALESRGRTRSISEGTFGINIPTENGEDRYVVVDVSDVYAYAADQIPQIPGYILQPDGSTEYIPLTDQDVLTGIANRTDEYAIIGKAIQVAGSYGRGAANAVDSFASWLRNMIPTASQQVMEFGQAVLEVFNVDNKTSQEYIADVYSVAGGDGLASLVQQDSSTISASDFYTAAFAHDQDYSGLAPLALLASDAEKAIGVGIQFAQTALSITIYTVSMLITGAFMLVMLGVDYIGRGLTAIGSWINDVTTPDNISVAGGEPDDNSVGTGANEGRIYQSSIEEINARNNGCGPILDKVASDPSKVFIFPTLGATIYIMWNQNTGGVPYWQVSMRKHLIAFDALESTFARVTGRAYGEQSLTEERYKMNVEANPVIAYWDPMEYSNYWTDPTMPGVPSGLDENQRRNYFFLLSARRVDFYLNHILHAIMGDEEFVEWWNSEQGQEEPSNPFYVHEPSWSTVDELLSNKTILAHYTQDLTPGCVQLILRAMAAVVSNVSPWRYYFDAPVVLQPHYFVPTDTENYQTLQNGLLLIGGTVAAVAITIVSIKGFIALRKFLRGKAGISFADYTKAAANPNTTKKSLAELYNKYLRWASIAGITVFPSTSVNVASEYSKEDGLATFGAVGRVYIAVTGQY